MSLVFVSPLLFLSLLVLLSLLSQREANGSFNTTEDSGLDAKFVNAVYDALLCTVSMASAFQERRSRPWTGRRWRLVQLI